MRTAIAALAVAIFALSVSMLVHPLPGGRLDGRAFLALLLTAALIAVLNAAERRWTR